MSLADDFRPETWADFIGNPKTVERLRAVLNLPDFGANSGEAFWISGPSGVGKTTLAWLIARELIGRDLAPGQEWRSMQHWCVLCANGKRCTMGQAAGQSGLSVAEIEQWLPMYPPTGGWKVAIIDEGQSLREGAVEAFLSTLDPLPPRRAVVFTSTSELKIPGKKDPAPLFGEFTAPFARRCKRFKLTDQGLCEPFAARAKEIAQARGLDGKPIAAYVSLLRDSHNNFGDALQRIGALEMKGD